MPKSVSSVMEIVWVGSLNSKFHFLSVLSSSILEAIEVNIYSPTSHVTRVMGKALCYGFGQ